jgi:Asp-tRNA(Asn)/Glu-tRNA(Gln) amidotransferase B subunit
LNSMVGQVMRETKGRADARRAQELFRARLGAP